MKPRDNYVKDSERKERCLSSKFHDFDANESYPERASDYEPDYDERTDSDDEE